LTVFCLFCNLDGIFCVVGKHRSGTEVIHWWLESNNNWWWVKTLLFKVGHGGRQRGYVWSYDKEVKGWI